MSLAERVPKVIIGKRTTYTVNGVRITLGELCDVCQVSYSTMLNRLKKGMSIDEALDTPIQGSMHRGVRDRKIELPMWLQGDQVCE